MKDIAKELSNKMENNTHTRCQQIKCSYHIEGGCKSCQSCSAPPHILKKDCETCISCSSEEGALRWEDNNIKLDNKKKLPEIKVEPFLEDLKPLVEEAMEVK